MPVIGAAEVFIDFREYSAPVAFIWTGASVGRKYILFHLSVGLNLTRRSHCEVMLCWFSRRCHFCTGNYAAHRFWVTIWTEQMWNVPNWCFSDIACRSRGVFADGKVFSKVSGCITSFKGPWLKAVLSRNLRVLRLFFFKSKSLHRVEWITGPEDLLIPKFLHDVWSREKVTSGCEGFLLFKLCLSFIRTVLVM